MTMKRKLESLLLLLYYSTNIDNDEEAYYKLCASNDQPNGLLFCV